MTFDKTAFFYGLLGAYLVSAFFCPDVFAQTEGDFAEEVKKVETFLTGGMARIGLIALCLIVAGASMVKQSIMGVLFGVGGAFFFFMMKGWINTSFPMIL